MRVGGRLPGMAQGRDASARKRRKRGMLRHYDRPLWRDRMFWVVAVPSVLATAVLVAGMLLLWGVPESALGWVRIVVVGLIVLNLGFRLLGFSLVTSRHFQRGLGEGSAKREGDWEDKGRAAGAMVGKAIRTTRKVSGSAGLTGSRPAPSDDEPATPANPTAETAARPPLSDNPRAPATVPADEQVSAASDLPGTPTSAVGDEPAGGAGTAATGEEDAQPATPTTPPPARSADSQAEPSTKETVDKAARVVGGMVGRRLAERRRKQG
jgi:hypothetical protein